MVDVLRDATLLFLIQKENDVVSRVLLAMKKRGFAVGRWNGVGGKVDVSEAIVEATVRETKEEIEVEVDISDLQKCAELSFTFPHNSEWSQKVHVYLTEKWEGYPTETDEMRPQWFEVHRIPYDLMWADDEHWLPRVLKGELLRGRFKFAEGDIVTDYYIENVDSF